MVPGFEPKTISPMLFVSVVCRILFMRNTSFFDDTDRDMTLLRLYYQPSVFDGLCILQKISLYLTSWQSAWGSWKSLWWGWGPLGGSHTMECHWYSPAHHQSSSSGTRLPCPHLQSVLQRTKQKAGGEATAYPKFYSLAPPNLWALSSRGSREMAPGSSKQQLKSWLQAIIYWRQSLRKPLMKEAIQ